MREIKFQVYAKIKDDDGNIGFLETCSPVATGLDFFYDGGWRGVSYFLFFPDVFVVRQYTGTKDKNGKEIYEGDIITFGSTAQEDLFEVVWDEDDARFVLDSYGGRGCWLIDVKDREIIGNIFENPELLEQ